MTSSSSRPALSSAAQRLSALELQNWYRPGPRTWQGRTVTLLLGIGLFALLWYILKNLRESHVRSAWIKPQTAFLKTPHLCPFTVRADVNGVPLEPSDFPEGYAQGVFKLVSLQQLFFEQRVPKLDVEGFHVDVKDMKGKILHRQSFLTNEDSCSFFVRNLPFGQAVDVEICFQDRRQPDKYERIAITRFPLPGALGTYTIMKGALERWTVHSLSNVKPASRMPITDSGQFADLMIASLDIGPFGTFEAKCQPYLNPEFAFYITNRSAATWILTMGFSYLDNTGGDHTFILPLVAEPGTTKIKYDSIKKNWEAFYRLLNDLKPNEPCPQNPQLRLWGNMYIAPHGKCEAPSPSS
jgi:hypothetical protein